MLLKDVQPTVMLRYMAVMASGMLLLATVALERDVLAALPPWQGPDADFAFYAWLTINCGFAFATNLFNFVVVKYTSPLTMQARPASRLASCLCSTVEDTDQDTLRTAVPLAYNAGAWQRPGRLRYEHLHPHFWERSQRRCPLWLWHHDDWRVPVRRSEAHCGSKSSGNEASA